MLIFWVESKMLLKKQYSNSYSQAPSIFKIYRSRLFSLSASINYEHNKSNRAYWNTYRPYSNELSRKIQWEWCYWNGIIWSWTYLLLKKNVNFETNWTLRTFIQVNENYSYKTFVDKFRLIKVNDAYQDFCY